MNKPKKHHPLAINFIRLQRFNFKVFDLEEAVLFEYFIMKAKSFSWKFFYHSGTTIQSEIGIKRAKLSSTITKFNKLGFLDFKVDGFPKVRHFLLKMDKVMELINQLYLESAIEDIKGEFQPFLEDYTIHQSPEIKKEKLQNKQSAATAKRLDGKGGSLMISLDRIFASRREMAGNEKKGYSATVLPRNSEIIRLAGEAVERLQSLGIENAFTAYADYIMKDESDIKHVLNYFFKKENEDFPVIEYFLDHFNQNYSFRKAGKATA